MSNVSLRAALVQDLVALRQGRGVVSSPAEPARPQDSSSTYLPQGRELRDLLLGGYNPPMAQMPPRALMDVLMGPTSSDPEGFPLLAPRTYARFRDHVPHLFGGGLSLLHWLRDMEQILSRKKDLSQEKRDSVQRAIKALRTMALTASLTAPSDLWLLRQILATHRDLGTLDYLNAGRIIDPDSYGRRHGINPRQLGTDFAFLQSRSYLDRVPEGFVRSRTPAGQVLRQVESLPEPYRIDMVGELISWIKRSGRGKNAELVAGWFDGRKVPRGLREGWAADWGDIELGYRLLPTVLAFKAEGLLELKTGQPFHPSADPKVLDPVRKIFHEAGLLEGDMVTDLGERVFGRGQGPFGIAGSYHPYTNEHERILLLLTGGRPHVERGENVDRSGDANRKVLREGVLSYDRYLAGGGRPRTVVIEHAVGNGLSLEEYARIRGTGGIHFVAADVEEPALARARKGHQEGRLPRNLSFVTADIGQPEKFIAYLRNDLKLSPADAVMFVGNGLHEMGTLSDQEMGRRLGVYADAGMLLVATEETGISPELQREAAWNQNNSNFMWTHATSGQWPRSEESWRRCFKLGGFRVLDQYTNRTRPMLPLKLPRKRNPSLSVTYFSEPFGA